MNRNLLRKRRRRKHPSQILLRMADLVIFNNFNRMVNFQFIPDDVFFIFILNDSTSSRIKIEINNRHKSKENRQTSDAMRLSKRK